MKMGLIAVAISHACSIEYTLGVVVTSATVQEVSLPLLYLPQPHAVAGIAYLLSEYELLTTGCVITAPCNPASHGCCSRRCAAYDRNIQHYVCD